MSLKIYSMDYTEEILKVLSTELEPYSTIDGQACIDGVLTSAHKLNELFQQKLKQCNVSGSLPPSGIKEFDELIKQFQNSEIDFLTLTCGLWNKGYNAGKEYHSGGNDR